MPNSDREMFVIPRQISRRRAACWATIRHATRARVCAKHFRGTRRSKPRTLPIRNCEPRMFAVPHNAHLMERGPFGAICALGIAILLLFAGPVGAQADVASAVNPQSNLVAQGLADEHGEGVPKDQRKAALLYCEGARAGDPEAMYSLGWMYENGRGVARSDAMASLLFARAAAAGHVYARQMQKYVGDDTGSLPDCMRSPEPEPPVALMDDGPDPFADLPPNKRKIAELVIKTVPQYQIEPRLALAVIATESNFQPDARSVK